MFKGLLWHLCLSFRVLGLAVQCNTCVCLSKCTHVFLLTVVLRRVHVTMFCLSAFTVTSLGFYSEFFPRQICSLASVCTYHPSSLKSVCGQREVNKHQCPSTSPPCSGGTWIRAQKWGSRGQKDLNQCSLIGQYTRKNLWFNKRRITDPNQKLKSENWDAQTTNQHQIWSLSFAFLSFAIIF